jgi:nucleotide-binding universal stress UspA family protein
MNVIKRSGSMEDVKRILVHSRSTKHCHKTVRHGVLLARTYNASLTILHIVHDPFGLDGWNIPLPFLKEIQHEDQKIHAEAESDLKLILDGIGAEGLSTEIRIEDGKPNEVLFDVIDKEKIDLLIVPAHHEWHVEHLLFSRINDEILRKLPCSVFFVKEEPY